MNLQELKDKGAIQAPHEPIEVTWEHADPKTGEWMVDTFIVHVRKMSVGWMDRMRTRAAREVAKDTVAKLKAKKNGTVAPKTASWSQAAALISAAILFGENADESLTYEEADLLDFQLSRALLRAFNIVNNRGPVDEDDENADEEKTDEQKQQEEEAKN